MTFPPWNASLIFCFWMAWQIREKSEAILQMKETAFKSVSKVRDLPKPKASLV